MVLQPLLDEHDAIARAGNRYGSLDELGARKHVAAHVRELSATNRPPAFGAAILPATLQLDDQVAIGQRAFENSVFGVPNTGFSNDCDRADDWHSCGPAASLESCLALEVSGFLPVLPQTKSLSGYPDEDKGRVSEDLGSAAVASQGRIVIVVRPQSVYQRDF